MECPAAAAEQQQTPKFQGESLPEPPAQKLPWKPPADSSLGPRVLQATDELFELGLADPRMRVSESLFRHGERLDR